MPSPTWTVESALAALSTFNSVDQVSLSDPAMARAAQAVADALPFLREQELASAGSFRTLVIPAASRLQSLAKCSGETLSRKLSTVHAQAWATLPAFMRGAGQTDLPSALFEDNFALAKALLAAVKEGSAEVKLAAIRGVTAAALELPSEDRASRAEKLLIAGDRCATTLADAFVALEPGSHQTLEAALATALEAVFVSMVSERGIRGRCEKWVQAVLKDPSGSDAAEVGRRERLQVRHAQLVACMAPALSAELHVKVLGALAGQLVAESEGRVQKAIFRILCAAVRQPEFSSFAQVWELLRRNRAVCSPGALKVRLALIADLLDEAARRGLSTVDTNSLRELVPEVLLATRDSSAQVRQEGWTVLHALNRATGHEAALQKELVTLLCAGLAGQAPGLRAASVEALGKVLFGSNLADLQLVRQVVMAVLPLLRLNQKQLYAAVLDFVRVVMQRTDIASAVQDVYDEGFMREVLHSPFAKGHRMKLRGLLEKLGRKFEADSRAKGLPEGEGWNRLYSVVPAEHSAWVKYIRKMSDRDSRRRADLPESDGDSGSEDDEERPRRRAEDDMVDDGEDEEEAYEREVAAAKKAARMPTAPVPAKFTDEGKLIVVENSDAELAESDDEPVKAKPTVQSRRAQQKQAQRMWERTRRAHQITGTDLSYGDGDAMGRAQRHDPYAYVRLNPRLMKEKHRAHAVRSLSRVVKKTTVKKQLTKTQKKARGRHAAKARAETDD